MSAIQMPVSDPTFAGFLVFPRIRLSESQRSHAPYKVREEGTTTPPQIRPTASDHLVGFADEIVLNLSPRHANVTVGAPALPGAARAIFARGSVTSRRAGQEILRA